MGNSCLRTTIIFIDTAKWDNNTKRKKSVLKVNYFEEGSSQCDSLDHALHKPMSYVTFVRIIHVYVLSVM